MLSNTPFAIDAQTVIDAARAIAEHHQHDAIEPEHLLLALLSCDVGPGHAALCRLDRHPDELRALAERALRTVPKRRLAGRAVHVSAGLRKLVELAAIEASGAGQEAIHSGHLLLALVHPRRGGVTSLLLARGVTYEQVRQLLTGEQIELGRVCEFVAGAPEPYVLANAGGEAAVHSA